MNPPTIQPAASLPNAFTNLLASCITESNRRDNAKQQILNKKTKSTSDERQSVTRELIRTTADCKRLEGLIREEGGKLSGVMRERAYSTERVDVGGRDRSDSFGNWLDNMSAATNEENVDEYVVSEP